MVKTKFILILLFTGICLVFEVNSVFTSTSDNRIQLSSPITLPDIQIIKGVVGKGDTISSILNKYLPLKIIYEISERSSAVFSLARIRKGQPYKIIFHDNNIIGFEYEINKSNRLVVQKEKDSFSINKLPIEYDVHLEVISSTITSSLFETVKKSGEKIKLALILADIFAWDIDFIRNIQPGDQLKVLVEKRYRNGKLVGYGKLHAAFFTNNGTLFKAFLYEDSEGVSGYYDENGISLQKAFLKVPLSFSRISSKFTQKECILFFKEYRSHPGVDYAAPKGTPIKTVGDGVITEIGFNRGMGNYINIRHYNGYITEYNHMCKFARGMKKNKTVFQGDVIGYVGMTGYATGPHLDFRMKKNGKLIDPLKHRPKCAKAVTSDEMKKFQAITKKLSTKILAGHKPDASAKKPT